MINEKENFYALAAIATIILVGVVIVFGIMISLDITSHGLPSAAELIDGVKALAFIFAAVIGSAIFWYVFSNNCY